jgi:hypothetical protein
MFGYVWKRGKGLRQYRLLRIDNYTQAVFTLSYVPTRCLCCLLLCDEKAKGGDGEMRWDGVVVYAPVCLEYFSYVNFFFNLYLSTHRMFLGRIKEPSGMVRRCSLSNLITVLQIFKTPTLT